MWFADMPVGIRRKEMGSCRAEWKTASTPGSMAWANAPIRLKRACMAGKTPWPMSRTAWAGWRLGFCVFGGTRRSQNGCGAYSGEADHRFRRDADQLSEPSDAEVRLCRSLIGFRIALPPLARSLPRSAPSVPCGKGPQGQSLRHPVPEKAHTGTIPLRRTGTVPPPP